MKPNNQSDVVISESPGYALGLCGVRWLRMLIFITLPDTFSIDFAEQKIATDTVYIIHPGHFYCLSEKQHCSFWCIDFFIDLACKDLLLALKYQNQKGIRLMQGELNFLTLPTAREMRELQAVLLLNKVITEYQKTINSDLADFEKNLVLAKRLLHLLSTSQEKLDVLTIANIARKLNCSERTLLRACRAVLGLTTKELVKKHLILIILYMLRFAPSVRAVAKDLGFADAKTFIRFIKNELSLTPKQVSLVMYSS